MIEIGLVDLEKDFLGGKVYLERIVVSNLELGDMAGVVPIGGRLFAERSAVKNKQPAVPLELWMKRQAEQASLVEALVYFDQPAPEIEKEFVLNLSRFAQHLNGANLIGNQEATGAIRERNESEG